MKKRILIIGKVHNVGYRPLLLGLAESLEIKRFFADNIKINGKQAVEILIDDEKEKITAFIELIKKNKPEKAEIEEIRSNTHKRKVMKTESYYRYLTAMQLAKIVEYGGKMLEKQDQMLEKQDKMLEKQDQMLEKQDKMLEKQDETIKEIRTVRKEIKELRQDLKTYMEQRFQKIEKEIEKIKAKIGL